MVTFTVKNIPVELHRKLKKKAERNHRSLNREILVNLQAAVGSAPLEMNSLLQEARQLRGQVSGRLTDNMLKKFKNEGRP